MSDSIAASRARPIGGPSLAVVAVAFVASGAAGIMYQTVWVRAFGNIFGNTVHSAAVVTSLFMGGLGLGGWWFGRYADRISPSAGPSGLFRVYALLEVAIGLLGVLASQALPLFEPLSGLASGYSLGDDGLYHPTALTHVFRYGAAALLLLPITCCMGGTLTVLVRALVRERASDAGPRIGLLYGVNTLGAALGAFLVDGWFIPTLGIKATQSSAALVNLVVALAALGWARSARTASTAVVLPDAASERADFPSEGSSTPGNDAPAPSSKRVLGAAAVALALSGFAGMGFEILWFRSLGAALGSHRSTFALLLTTMLLGLFLGALIGSTLVRRLRGAASLAGAFAVVQGLVVTSALLCLAGYELSDYLDPELVQRHASGSEGGRRLVETWLSLRPILAMVLGPAIFMGIAYPLANAAVQEALSEVGTRAGLLYLVNTVGGIAGSLLTGFIFIPWLGMQATASVVGCVALLAAAPLLVASRTARVAPIAGLGLGCAGLAAFLLLPGDHLLGRLATVHIVNERVVTTSEGPIELIAVSEAPTGERTLWTNGHPMTGTHYMAQRYMRAFVHVPMLMHPSPERVLVICFGVGNTVHAASLYPEVSSIEVADLSEHVVRHSTYFERWNHGVRRDPRLRIHLNDGRQHLRTLPEATLDLVTLEPPPLTHAGVAALYSREFYELVHSRLRPGGYVTQWLPIYQVPGEVAVAMIKAFIDVFPGGVLLSGYGRELILMGTKGPRVIFDPDAVAARLASHPAVREDLEAIDLARLSDLVTTFAGSAERMKALTEGMLALTDDSPILEYTPDKLTEAIIPVDLFGPDELGVFCPKCKTERSDLPHLQGLIRLNQALYHSNVFRVITRTREAIHPRFYVRKVSAEVARAAWASSGYLRRLIPEAVLPR